MVKLIAFKSTASTKFQWKVQSFFNWKIAVISVFSSSHVADFIDKKIILSCNVWRAGKDSRDFFVIEKQSSEEEMQQIKIFFSCFVFLTCKEYKSSFHLTSS